MKRQTLHEIAKFCAGLILGDFLVGVWLLSQGLFPVSFLGVTVTSATLAPWLLFDVALFIILVHYGWHFGKLPRLRERSYLMVIGVVFGVVALVHLIRAFAGSDLNILGWYIPLWLSWIAVVVSGYLSYMSFHLALHMRR